MNERRKLKGKDAVGKKRIRCRKCGKPFIPVSPFIRFCSRTCRDIYIGATGYEAAAKYERWIEHRIGDMRHG